jgi:hypothetical protein
MIAAIIKIIGTVHGLFGLWTLLIIPVAIANGMFKNLSSIQTAIKIVATLFGATMLFLCMWSSWMHAQQSYVYAWIALGVFVLSAFSDTVALHGSRGLLQLMPAFYKAAIVRAITALLLTLLVFIYQSQ